jgi:uncharacterized protein YecT (DUF1311 family)
LSLIAAAAALATAALGAAHAQDEEDAAPAPASEEEILEADMAFTQECLDTLALRGAPAHVCLGIVARQCASEAEDETTTGAAVCEAREAAAWAGLLDAVAGELEAAMPNARREDFRDAQSKWADFRDAECAYEAAAYRSEVEIEASRAACVKRLTANRVIALNAPAEER